MNNIFKIKDEQELSYNLSTNLSIHMKISGVSEAELSRSTKIPQPTLHKILTGKTEDPRFSTLQQLATFFNISVDELVMGAEKIQRKFDTKMYSIPVVTWRDCLKGPEFISSLSPKIWKNWIAIENIPSGAFGIGSTASAEPRFPRGTIFIIDPHAIPKDGDLVVIEYDSAEEATLRELSIDGPNKFLLPINIGSSKDRFDESKKIQGVVIEYRFSYV